MRVRSLLKLGAVVLLVTGIYGPAQAMGRRGDYQDSPAYSPERVERGSPANPTPAYMPPKFDNYTPSNPGPANPPPMSNTKAPPKPESWTIQNNTIQQTPPASGQNQAPPSTKPASVAPDTSEPPLPDVPTDVNPGTDIHPTPK